VIPVNIEALVSPYYPISAPERHCGHQVELQCAVGDTAGIRDRAGLTLACTLQPIFCFRSVSFRFPRRILFQYGARSRILLG
jgi:hypothetical protein